MYNTNRCLHCDAVFCLSAIEKQILDGLQDRATLQTSAPQQTVVLFITRVNLPLLTLVVTSFEMIKKRTSSELKELKVHLC